MKSCLRLLDPFALHCMLLVNSSFLCWHSKDTSHERVELLEEFSTQKHPLQKLRQAIENSELYNSLSKLPYYQNVKNSKPTYVVGDVDGDFARLIFAAYMSGYVDLTAEGVDLLISLMSLTSSTYVSNPELTFVAVQQSREIYEIIEKLKAHISYRNNPNSKLIFIGDVLFDRFSNNLGTMLDVVRGLHASGAIFIKGNHDYYEFFKSCYEEIISDHYYAAHGGAYSIDASDIYNLSELSRKCKEVEDLFVLSYYDHKLDILFTHAAIKTELDEAGNAHVVYCDHIFNNSIGMSAGQLSEEICKLNISYDDMVGWRPCDYDKLTMCGTLLVHGHDGNASNKIFENTLLKRDELSGVLMINSRTRDQFSPIVILIV